MRHNVIAGHSENTPVRERPGPLWKGKHSEHKQIGYPSLKRRAYRRDSRAYMRQCDARDGQRPGPRQRADSYAIGMPRQVYPIKLTTRPT